MHWLVIIFVIFIYVGEKLLYTLRCLISRKPCCLDF